jgi:hypothetical protein
MVDAITVLPIHLSAASMAEITAKAHAKKANPDNDAREDCGSRGYNCLDPAATAAPTKLPTPQPTLSPSVSAVPTVSVPEVCTVRSSWVGNGRCSGGDANVAACGYDGGDCCEASCLNNPNYYYRSRCGSRGYDCKDPAYL